MNIKKDMMGYSLKFLLVALFALPIPFLKSGKAQAQTSDFSIDYKNKLSAGVYLASGEIGKAGDVLTFFYGNEYTRSLNRYFSLGVGIGFANRQKMDYSTTLSNGEIFKSVSQASFVSFNAIPYFNIIRTHRSQLTLGAGLSVRLVTSLSPESTYFNLYPSLPALSIYKHEKVWETGLVSGIEYGFRVSPHFILSIKANLYFVGKKSYSSLLVIGFNIGYLF